MTEIKKIENYSAVMFAFPPKLRYFAEVEAAGGAVFCAYKDGAPVGLICLREQQGALDTVYLYTSEAHRRTGIAKSLADYAADYAEKSGKNFRLRVPENNPGAAALHRIAADMNMRLDGEILFLTLEVNEESKRAWEDYRPGLIKRIARLEKRLGAAKAVTFAEAGQDLLDELRTEIGVGLPGLDPFKLPDINPDYSLILTHGDKIIAFNAVRTVGRKMVYEISAARGGMTLAAGVPPFFDRLFASDTERVTCAVYADNADGLSHAQGQFGFLFKNSGRQIIYIL